MLLRCCLIRHFLYWLYLCPCLDLGLFMSHLCDMYVSISSPFLLWLIVQSRGNRHTCSFAYFLECSVIFRWLCGWRMWIISEQQKISLRVLHSICFIFYQFQPGVAYKSVAYKKESIYLEVVFVLINFETTILSILISQLFFVFFAA